MTRTLSVHDLFDSPLHRRWTRDRRQRHRVPAPLGARGCVGLAVLFDGRPEEYLHHGLRVLAPNDRVRWLAIRDVPPGRFPASPQMDRRVVNWASLARADLRYGIPALDFAHPLQPAWDFGYVPVAPFDLPVDGYGGTRRAEAGPDTLDPDRFPREFAALCSLTEAMTAFAFFGLDAHDRPVRRPWFGRRPRDGRPRRIKPLHRAMPRPMLAFRPEQVDRLFWASADLAGERRGVPCSDCRSVVPLRQLDNGDVNRGEPFVARCPCCRRRVRWDPEDARPCRSRRLPTLPSRDAFTDAATEGLPLAATEPCTYLGASADTVGDADHGGRLDLVTHRFRSHIDDREWGISLPVTARLLVRPGHHLDPDEAWARALTEVPDEGWRRRPRAERCRDLASACGGNAVLACLQRLWFSQQAIRLREDPGHVLLPADLVAPACRDVPPSGLYWDLTPCIGGFVPDAEAFVLPPVWLRHWDELVLALPGDVRVDATVGDPRFRPERPQLRRLPKPTDAAGGGVDGRGGDAGRRDVRPAPVRPPLLPSAQAVA